MQLPYANLTLKHWNPGAKLPLILPVQVLCNTSDEQIYDNVRANSRAHRDWLKEVPAHDGVAVLCGSGPSLADTIDDIRRHAAARHTIFAMNGAARFLAEHRIKPDYQVIIDARPETATLVGPARSHLFASQVSPETFARAPDAKLWHLQVENIDDLLPEYEDDFVMIGGAASVGNTATCLAYAMGYRDLQIYGYDSSHRDGNGHAFHQKMNDGDPCAIVMFNGKEYTASLTMKLQAERFQETAQELRALGCRIAVHGTGLLPDIYNAPKEVLTETQKYERMWSHQEYRMHSPGEHCVEQFLELVNPRGQQVIDFGCGTGRGGLKLAEAECEVMLVDFAENCRDEAAKDLPFVQHDLTKPLALRAPFGFCTDVMEHIPPPDVRAVIETIMSSARTVFFQISTVPDNLGALINQELHLTVRRHAWWKEQFFALGHAVEWESYVDHASMFLITSKEHACQP